MWETVAVKIRYNAYISLLVQLELQLLHNVDVNITNLVS